MSASDLPYLNDELLDALDTIYPSKPPDLLDNDRQIWYKAGQRSVVDFLKKHQERQKETMLSSTVLEGQI
tara:strand:- start:210 stop:419 length:210 start_codon:yes stop_codon:yes gene_type:complete